jgi:hypothetical protein
VAAGQTYQGLVDPGELLVLRVGPDGGVQVESESANELTAAAVQAVAAVPAWLAPDLSDALRRAETQTQDALAELILGVGDPDLVDEVGYTVARLAPEDVSNADLELVRRNAEQIYEVAPELEFAELVEVGEGADRYTTVRYRLLVDEAEVWWELPRDDYYDWVVHPQRDNGYLRFVDPTTGVDANADSGVFFRDYLWNDTEGLSSYRGQIALRWPNLIDDGWLGTADFGSSAPAHGILVEFDIDPIVLVRDADSGGPVAVSFVWGNGGCHNNTWPAADGWVYATTIPVEAAADAGDVALLENLLYAGGGNQQLPYDVLVYGSNYFGNPASVLVVRDRLPFDLGSDPNELLLQIGGYEVEVVDSQTFAALEIIVDEPVDPDPEVEGDEYVRHYPNGFSKIVVPSDQPLSLYQTLADKTEEVESFVNYGGVLELHLATRPEDDWSGLRLPTGIHSGGQDTIDQVLEIERYGYPLLKDAVAGAQYLWDGVQVTPEGAGAGHLPLDEGMTAVERLGWWTSQLLTMRVCEQKVWARVPSVQRSEKPERIAWNHYGNCGELGDLMTAGGRTALIPVMSVGTLADDHVWNEFPFQDVWVPLEASWSDSSWHVDDYRVAYDDDTGSSSNSIAGLVGWRGDGLIYDLLGRYEPEVIDDEDHIHGDYSRYVTLTVDVEDRVGVPVDGALVLVATPGFYDPEQLSVCTWGHTDRVGAVSFTVGEGNDYYFQVSSSLGILPGPNLVSSWLTAEETAEPGQEFDVVAVYEDAGLPLLADPVVAPPDAGFDEPILTVEVVAEREILYGQNLANDRTFAEPVTPGLVDVYVVDAENFARLSSGDQFQAAAATGQVDDVTIHLRLPRGSEWRAVVSNRRRQASAQQVTVDVVLDALGDDTGSVADGSCGCGAVGGRRPPARLVSLLLAAFRSR